MIRRISRDLQWLRRTRAGNLALGLVLAGVNVGLGAGVPILLPIRWLTFEDAQDGALAPA